ncbi:TonB-dependent receptor [Stenotrophomonas sp. MMGLT7]|uniref:TonB-dependent receptor n=1 Tax=Stenotrophomonas sp. MMGLT7 TaxID=2901227 RepID=UPI001E56FDD6|nr:TonB-dependent receptor [Stenotrophomonas sp. MMGLT7]MCD7098235.1 TonB-dependent receptor [Stenotrophomonas sp. MMGLT7]
MSVALASILAAPAHAQSTTAAEDTTATGGSRVTASSTSNTTSAYDTRRIQELDKIDVTAQSPVLGGGSMLIQTAPKAISTVTREAIAEEAGGSNFTQLIDSIPGVDASTDDPSGLANGNYSLRGFDSSSIGITVNGAPITDTGSYSVYATEYGDAENYNDITVMQGTPNVDQPEMGAAGGQIAWSSIDPTHDFGVDFVQSFGNYDYKRSFVRMNTGDLGPVRSWISISKNTKDKWKGAGDMDVTKIDGKSIWQIDDANSISLSFQYNRQSNYSYANGTKQDIQADYEYDYNTDWYGSQSAGASNNAYYYKLRRNPFRSLMVSLDGEFAFSDDLRLSVVPYLWWGDGGGSSGSNYFRETANTAVNQFDYANQDLNGDGVISNGSAAFTGYQFSHSKTLRPGVVAKFIQNVGLDHTLSYGAWFERSRKSQTQDYSLVDQSTGEACDVWADSDGCLIYYPDGTPQQGYRTYTVTTVQKYFLQDNWTPSDRWQFNLGVAYLKATRKGHNYQWPGADYASSYYTGLGRYLETETLFDNDYSEFLPALGIKFMPDDRNQFFYGVGKTFRVPSTNSITLNTVTGNTTSQPETAITHDLGWRFYGDRFGMAAMVYQSDYKNKQMSSYDNDLALTTYVWIPKVRMRGANWEASYAFDQHWKAYLSYTRTEAQVRSSIVDTGDDGAYPIKGKQLADTPKDIASARLSWSNGEFWASLKAKYSGSRYGDYMNTEKVGGYTVVGLNAGVNLPDIGAVKKPVLKLNISNLFDRKAYTYVSNAPWVSEKGYYENQAAAESYDWYYDQPEYGVLAPRTIMVSFGGSF